MSKKQYLLDTNICISLLKNKYGVRDKVRSVGLKNCYISEITVAELFYGASKSQRKDSQIKDVYYILDKFKVMPIYNSLETYGDIKSHLELNGMRVDDFDLLIGATAIYNNCIMVTGNTKHFERMPKIILENWHED